MSKLLQNKVVLVTGGGSGIGRSSSILFAKEGAKVVIANRSEKNGKETVDIIRKNGGEAIFIQTDISKKNNIINCIEKLAEKYGRLDCAFNCGGIDGVKKPITEIEEDEWDEVINTNLKGTFLLLKYEIIQMLKQGKSNNNLKKAKYSIVNMSSINSLLGRPNRAPYNASRSGINGLTKTIAIEYIKKGIRVNAIAPAAVETDLFYKYTNYDKKTQENYALQHPIGRICAPEEIAEAALWLLSNKSSFIIGHILMIDGGITLK